MYLRKEFRAVRKRFAKPKRRVDSSPIRKKESVNGSGTSHGHEGKFSTVGDVDKWLFFDKAANALTRGEMRPCIPFFRREINCIKTARHQLLKRIREGRSAVCCKASAAWLWRHPDYDACIMAEMNGCDVSRWLKPSRDRTMQEVLEFSNLHGGANVLGLTLCETLEQPTERLAVTAGLCRSVSELVNVWFPAESYPKLRNGILPIQCGVLLDELIRWPDFKKIRSIDWSDLNEVADMFDPSKQFLWQIQELIERANQPLREIPVLSEAVDLLTIDNVAELLDQSLPFAWGYILASELVPSEIMIDDAGLSMLGVFDEFYDYDRYSGIYHRS